MAIQLGQVAPDFEQDLTFGRSRRAATRAGRRTMRLIITYPPSTGHNFNEILRVVERPLLPRG